MRRHTIIVAGSILLFLGFSPRPQSQEDLKIWRSFVETLKGGEFPAEKIRPLHEDLAKPLQGFLDQMRELATWSEWEKNPEVVEREGSYSYIIPLTFNEETADFSFTFVVEDNHWYLQHFETIFVRLDKITSLPASEFPDMPEDRKIRFRIEHEWSDKVRLFTFLVQEKGEDFAFSWFKDGYGYSVAARAQVPYIVPHKAFILFLCWDLANFRGNEVTLEKLDDFEAQVRMRLHLLYLYEAAAHLKPQITYENYRKIFETIWLDRAEKAGWNLKILYEDDEVIFHFTRQ